MKNPPSTTSWGWYTALKRSDKRASDYLVDHLLPIVIRKLKPFGAQRADAEDVFMDVAESVFRRVRKTERTFFIEEKFQAYFVQACVWCWLKKSGRKSLFSEVTNDEMEVLFTEQDIVQELIETEQSKLFWSVFHKMGEACQQVLRLFFIEELSLREIATEMGYKYQYAKKKKYTCYHKLVEMIEQDPLYTELTDKKEYGKTGRK